MLKIRSYAINLAFSIVSGKIIFFYMRTILEGYKVNLYEI